MQQEQKNEQKAEQKQDSKPLRPQSYHINVRTCGAMPRL